MKVAAAYLLAVLGGKATPTAADVNAVLASVGAEADNVDALIADLEGILQVYVCACVCEYVYACACICVCVNVGFDYICV